MLIHLQLADNIVKNRLKYLIDFIRSHPFCRGRIEFTFEKIEGVDLELFYGTPTPDGFFIPMQGHLFQKEARRSNSFISNAYKWKSKVLYSVETEKKQASDFIVDNNFGFDVFESLFFHISRYEEYFTSTENLDKMGMFKQDQFFLIQEGIEKIPVVDQLLLAFCEVLGIEIETRKTSFILTHDIDKIHKYNSWVDLFKTIAWPVVFQYDLKQAYHNLVSFFKVKAGKLKDPYDTYDFLFLEKGRWKKKIVYFMAGGKSRYDLYDSYYKKEFKSLVLKAQHATYEIGLHPSFETADDFSMLIKEKKTIENESSMSIKHSRQHFLRFFPKKTSELIEKAGFKTDSSLGFTKRIGFRTGTGFEHHLYDFNNERAFDFQELPLVLMDSSLIHQTGGNMEEFRKQLLSFIQMNNMGTQITINFHNSTFDSTIIERKLLKSIYLEMEAMVNSL